ncbi:hypothetical protein MAR_014413 [Mya arenaria]|uniref:Uncharacterized protein n=1 Tax=Mya arenaria TaxID=6604 RepID=A0ABY7G5C7_MYAAR|nr:hypothetical protein MAR_014413 [Mya arenaria]
MEIMFYIYRIFTEPMPSTTYDNATFKHVTRESTLKITPISHPVPEGTTESVVKEEGGSSTVIVVGVEVVVTLFVVGVLAVLIKRRYMTRACSNNAATGKPSTEVSTAADNQQRVEYVNTANNEVHSNSLNTYEKLNMTKGVDNYLSLQEINAVEHDYQNA